MDSTHLFSLILLTVSAIMAYYHHRTWLTKRAAIDERSDDVESQLDFADRQYRRRIQVSAMLGIVAVAMFASRWIDPWRQNAPWIYMTYWLVIVIIVLWVVLLAMADYVATRRFLDREHQDQVIKEAQLRAEAYKMSRREKEQADDQG